MTKILSQEEVDTLLASAAAARGYSVAQGADDLGIAREKATTYDFRRPDRVSKEQVRSLQLMHDRFARNLSTSLSAYLRAVTEVTSISVEQCAYSEFLLSLPEVTAYYAVSLVGEMVGALELNPAIAFTMTDRLLGGSGLAAAPSRALTEIEQNVVDSAVRLIVENLTETWNGIIDQPEFKVQARETRPQMLPVVSPNDIVIALAFDVKIGDARGLLNFCVPASIVELAGANLSKTWRSRRLPTGDDERRLLASLSRVRLPISIQLDATVSARDIAQLKPGDVLSLAQSARSPIQVMVSSLAKFNGRLVAREGRGVITITEVIAADGRTEAAAR